MSPRLTGTILDTNSTTGALSEVSQAAIASYTLCISLVILCVQAAAAVTIE
jgi:hypothetical protein